MMTIVPAIALALGLGAPWSAGGAAMKCGAPPDAPALVALDGRIVPIAVDEVEREKALYVQVLCGDPDDRSTFTRVRTGIGVASVWTVDGPLPDMKPALETILAAQAAHHGANGAYLDSLDTIDLGAFHGDISVTLRTTSGGWVAVTTVPNLLAQCLVYVGDIDDVPDGLEAGEAACLDDQGHRIIW